MTQMIENVVCPHCEGGRVKRAQEASGRDMLVCPECKVRADRFWSSLAKSPIDEHAAGA